MFIEILFELFVIMRSLLVTALKLILDSFFFLDFLRDVEISFFGVLGSICSILECFENYAQFVLR